MTAGGVRTAGPSRRRSNSPGRSPPARSPRPGPAVRPGRASNRWAPGTCAAGRAGRPLRPRQRRPGPASPWSPGGCRTGTSCRWCRATTAGWLAAMARCSTRRSRSPSTSCRRSAGSTKDSARISSNTGRPFDNTEPVIANRCGSTDASRCPPTMASSASTCSRERDAVPSNRVAASSSDLALCEAAVPPNGTRRRTSTNGVPGLRTAIIRRPLLTVSVSSSGCDTARAAVSSGSGRGADRRDGDLFCGPGDVGNGRPFRRRLLPPLLARALRRCFCLLRLSRILLSTSQLAPQSAGGCRLRATGSSYARFHFARFQIARLLGGGHRFAPGTMVRMAPAFGSRDAAAEAI